MAKTLRQLIAEARQLLFEIPTGDSLSAGGDAPLLWPALIVRAVDTIAQETYCMGGERQANLVAGQPLYCVPDLFRALSFGVLDAGGMYHALEDVSTMVMDKQFPSWRSWPAGDPRFVVDFSPNIPFKLAPAPSYSVAGGFLINGYYAPGEVWARDGAGAPLPLTLDSVCPLPDFALPAVAPYAASYRIIQFPTKDNGNRLPMIQKMCDDWRAEVETRAARFFPRSRRSRGSRW